MFQALAAVAVPAKMAAGRRLLLLLAASLGTGAGKQVTGKVLSSTPRLRRPILSSCPRCLPRAAQLSSYLEKLNSKV